MKEFIAWLATRATIRKRCGDSPLVFSNRKLSFLKIFTYVKFVNIVRYNEKLLVLIIFSKKIEIYAMFI